MSTNTRDRVLKTLLLRQECTINELADSVGIKPISVRHHLAKLEAEGLIASTEERHDVGRPRFVYTLTKKGMEEFPTRYLTLTLRLLEQLKATLPEKMVGELFRKIAQDMALELTEDLNTEDLPIEERLNILKDLMATEGFTVEWQKVGDTYHIIEANCPYHHVGESHTEICTVSQELIANVTSVTPTQVTCILDGDAQCKYIVPAPEHSSEK
ncbi:MAG: ArsR family transcriptional regulator [Chloroflexota bacterium]|nr:ArsR family transcriptional regulator [Chloroflexota bacterium]